MADDSVLYRELYQLRQDLKEEGKSETGRVPVICSDEALEGIVAIKPKTVSDFGAVPGIGTVFMESYAEAFLQIIDKYRPASENCVDIDSSVMKVMKELEKKLVSLSRRNRLLYMPKIVERYAFDISYSPSVPDLLFREKPVTLADPTSGDGTEESRYKKAAKVIREAAKDLRDKGQNDLYVAYPFVKGRLAGEKFDVRSPLALFPVKAEKGAKIVLKLDLSRDIVYNNILILAQQKLLNASAPLPDSSIMEPEEQSFMEELMQFYRINGLDLIPGPGAMQTFRSYTADEFPQFSMGELHVEECAVLGKFPSYTSAVQRDFETIMEDGKVNVLLKDLLSGADDMDMYSDAYSEEETKEKTEVSEKDLFYINRLDGAQENVLAAIQGTDELVVQGPPGTGKSQTITSLITEFASQGKTVMLVSEKKTALDVVYSRLGGLSKYAMLIDDVGNKDLFYGQLSSMFTSAQAVSDTYEIDRLSREIDGQVARLRNIADSLYTPGEFGIEPYKLYRLDTGLDMNDRSSYEKYRMLQQTADPGLSGIQYGSLCGCRDRFSDPYLTGRMESYIYLQSNCPWLDELKGDLTQHEIFGMEDDLDGLKTVVDTWRHKNFLSRIFGKGKVKRSVAEFADKYFYGSSPETGTALMERPDDVRKSLASYDDYQQMKPVYNSLNSDETAYVRSIIALAKDKNYAESCNDIFNLMIYDHMSRFEAQHRDALADIDGFDSIVKRIGEDVEKKRELSRRKLENVLAADIGNIISGKRGMEIKRITESKRRWSVSRFINKFRPEILTNINIWLMTPEVVSEIMPLDAGIVDLVIFDEASQMYVEKGLPAIMRGKKVVVAGDHKQLRPSSLGAGRIDSDIGDADESESAALEEESLLDLARFRYRDVLLKYHYRSKYEELIAFSNYAFYKGQLYVAPNPAEPAKPPIEVHTMEDARWQNRSNMKEAEYTVGLLREILKSRQDSETIGIITFNITQRDLIEDVLDRECARDPSFAAAVEAETRREFNGEDIGLFVKNIESVQGDERDIIIFSVGYAKNESGRLVRNFGWLSQQGGENRLNVAVSRAKKKIHVVMSFDPDELTVEDTKNDGPRILKKYLQYAAAISDGRAADAQDVLLSFGDAGAQQGVLSFDSDFENQVYDRLAERGYQVDSQVGIGGYRIDLAVRKNGRYVLGIECDGKLYHSSVSARERDFHRQNYLESRGWRIHRIWSTNWWKNPEAEIQKICNIVDLA